MAKPFVITGFPYAFPYYFKVFEYLDNKDKFVFILPGLWLAKKGKVKIRLQQKPSHKIYGLRPASYGGHGVRGLFKGWMPGIIFLLPYLKLKYGAKVLYSCSEPNLLTTLYNGIIAKFCGFKHILFTWQNIPPEQYMGGLKLRIYTILVRLNLFFADGIICGNKKAADIVREFKVESEKFKVLISPISGVDTDKFRPGITSNWRAKLSIKLEEKLILFYGAIDKRKGVNVLIESFKLLITDYRLPIIKLVIIGTGPEEESLKLQVKSLKLQEKIIFLDWMSNDQLPALLNAADVFVYPSVPSGGWEEQFGYAMAEASACGIPVVATKTGSIDEVVLHGETGLLVEPNNSEKLAGAISKILSNPNLAKQIGRSGRKYIIENFSHQVISGKIINFLYDMYDIASRA
ncbi:MAG: glycosyltransferase family 4 protein [Candidatus Yanofskybacteria bacterium]|nr:glycosyltransferase family 4 protein [Candidatus Yanofskybacteria bacterium]